MTFPAVRESQNRFGVTCENLLFAYLDTNGDGTGTTDQTGNYSITPETFYYEVPAGKQVTIEKLTIEISDTTGFTSLGYGSGPALTNGIHVSVHDELNQEILLMTPAYVKSNSQWAGVVTNTTFLNFGGGTNTLICSWLFSSAGSPLVVKPGYTVEATLNDDFTGLTSQRMMIQGYMLDTPN